MGKGKTHGKRRRRDKSKWLDFSQDLIHLTEGGEDSNQAYQNFMSILASGTLKPGRTFGCVKDRKDLGTTQEAVCFSEIPIGFLERLYEKRSYYGIAFKKKHMLRLGGGPVWYLERGTPPQVAFESLVKSGTTNTAEPIWALTPFVDFTSGNYRAPYEYQWEREWRHLGPLHFKPEDVAFLLLPEDLHGPAWSFFGDAVSEDTGPGYFCLYMDARWSPERARKAVKEWKSALRKSRRHSEERKAIIEKWLSGNAPN